MVLSKSSLGRKPTDIPSTIRIGFAPDKLELLSMIDILVDGRYDRSKRNLMLQFRGSSNQRIIDVQKSLKSGQVVIWDKLNDGKESYEQVKRE